MTQDKIQLFIDEIYSKGPKRNYSTNTTGVYHTGRIWSLGILYLKDDGPANITSYSCV